MGTRTKELQNKILEQINRLDWSVNRLARELYYDEYDEDDHKMVKAAEERLKKQLKRTTTSELILEEILNKIPQLPLFKKTRLVAPHYIESDELSECFRQKMKALSKQLTDELE